jgi:hypothetical protein
MRVRPSSVDLVYLATDARRGFSETSSHKLYLAVIELACADAAQTDMVKAEGDTLSSAATPLRSARRIFALWGGLAVLSFVFAGCLTKIIVRVNDVDYRPLRLSLVTRNAVDENAQYVSVFSRELDANTHIRVDYDDLEGKHGGRARIVLASLHHPDATILLNNVVGTRSCTQQGQPLELTKIPTSTDFEMQDVYLMDWEENIQHIVCDLKSVIVADTFTTRTVRIVNTATKDDFVDRYMEHETLSSVLESAAWNFGDKPVTWRLDETKQHDAENITILLRTSLESDESRGPTLDAVRQTFPGDHLEVHWKSPSQDSVRDILLVIIGSAIALGAAMFLEALRPFVERFVQGSKD